MPAVRLPYLIDEARIRGRLMLLAGLVTATVVMITVRLMHAHDAANDRQPVPITHAADGGGARTAGIFV